jgi:hypothetical protein
MDRVFLRSPFAAFSLRNAIDASLKMLDNRRKRWRRRSN